MIPLKILKRRVITPTGCWEWTGCRVGGYGQIQIKGVVYYVHRLVASIVMGFDINDNSIHVLHSCDNPPCFNPDHLTKGTPKSNCEDSLRKGRRSTCGSSRKGFFRIGKNYYKI